jgi:hypothetical protein
MGSIFLPGIGILSRRRAQKSRRDQEARKAPKAPNSKTLHLSLSHIILDV